MCFINWSNNDIYKQMRYIRALILLTWFMPVLLLISPFHSYGHEVNVIYVLMILSIIFLATCLISRGQMVITSSIIKNSVIRNTHLIISAFLLCTSIVTLLSLISRGGGLSENREIFENEYQTYNYLFVATIFSSIIISLSKYATRREKVVATLTWIICGVLLLSTGNRQFVFFSLVYVILYRLGLSANPRRLFIKILILIFSLVAGAVLFSILRLDYINASDLGQYGSYLSTLTEVRCESGPSCDTALETIFQLLYAYSGMNYAGLTYSIDFFDFSGGLPFGSSTFPVIYRRLGSFGLSIDLGRYLDDYDQYISMISGGNFSHFFSTMFGNVAIETGLGGIIVLGVFLLLAVRISSIVARESGNEISYMIFIFICTSTIFGLLQFPFNEPFVFLAFINLSTTAIIEFFGISFTKKRQIWGRINWL